MTESHEPAEFATGAIARSFRDVISSAKSREAWLLVFADLLDKVRQAEPRPELLYLLHAAIASAPNEAQRKAAKSEVTTFEAELRGRLKDGTSIRPLTREGLEVLIIVPKSVERKALDAVFEIEAVSARPLDSRVRYRRFELTGVASIMVTAVCAQEAGNLISSNIVRDYVSALGRPDLAVLCGMAMGLSGEVPVGGVVIANQVFDYEPQRLAPDGGVSRFDSFRIKQTTDADARHTVDAQCDRIVQRHVKARDRLVAAGVPAGDLPVDPHETKMKFGVTLSGDKLVEDNEGPSLVSLHDRSYALEMEGAGFAAACHRLDCEWLVVRGIADHGEQNRGKSAQLSAALGAASFVRVLLETEWSAER
jgi:nucleoside phosphorylase